MGAGYVFISYSRVDSSFVGELVDHLAAHQIPTWFDHRISPGEYWSKEIEVAINSCSAFIVVMSQSARTSRWVALELNHSASRDKKIIPLLLNGELFFELNTIEYEDVSSGRMPTPRTISQIKSLTDEGLLSARTIPSATMAPPHSTTPKVWHVPPRNPLFAGREEILRAIGHHRRGGRESITILSGPGGVGKSSIAIEYAYRHSAEFDLVWWMDARSPSSVDEQLAVMAHSLGLVENSTELKSAVVRARSYLRRHGNWLIGIEDAENADAALGILPSGTGRILITSRDSRFHEIGAVIDVSTFSRKESVAFLKAQLSVLTDTEADALAAAVGDLPLAAAQAGGFMRETGANAGEYLEALEGHASELLRLGRPANYPRSVAAVIALSVDELRRIDQLALEMLRLCVFLAPEPIPVVWMLHAPSDAFGDALTASTPPSLQLRASVGQLMRLGLARLIDGDGDFVVHRITRAIVRDLLNDADRSVRRQRVLRLLLTARPDDLSDVVSWTLSAPIAAHIRYLGRVSADDPQYVNSQEFRTLVLDVARYLEVSGRGDLAQTLSGHAYTSWSRYLGPDHLDSLSAAHRRGATLPPGDSEAVPIVRDVLARRRRLLGVDHRESINTASNLAMCLAAAGQHEEARRIDEDTLARRRRTLGWEHPDTIQSVNNLGNRFSSLGDHAAAIAFHQQALHVRRRDLGEYHPDTLRTKSSLARDLANLGRQDEALRLATAAYHDLDRILGSDHRSTMVAAEVLGHALRASGYFEQALAVDELNLTRRQSVLGTGHLETINSVSALAEDLRRLGRTDEAEQVEEDRRTRPE